MKIPMRVRPRWMFWLDNIGPHQVEAREISGHQITFLVEETRADCAHACSVADIARVLSLVPPCDLGGLSMIILRQPTRKEELVDSAWGRWVAQAEIGSRKGTAIFLDAQDLSRPLRWSKRLSLHLQRRLQRLRDDGHAIRDDGRFYHITRTLNSVRTTQLFWTLPHEIGHHVDFRRDPNAFCTKPGLYAAEEAFADRYADEFQAKLRAAGAIPFERLA